MLKVKQATLLTRNQELLVATEGGRKEPKKNAGEERM